MWSRVNFQVEHCSSSSKARAKLNQKKTKKNKKTWNPCSRQERDQHFAEPEDYDGVYVIMADGREHPLLACFHWTWCIPGWHHVILWSLDGQLLHIGKHAVSTICSKAWRKRLAESSRSLHIGVSTSCGNTSVHIMSAIHGKIVFGVIWITHVLHVFWISASVRCVQGNRCYNSRLMKSQWHDFKISKNPIQHLHGACFVQSCRCSWNIISLKNSHSS